MILSLTIAACLQLKEPKNIPYIRTIRTVSCKNHVDPRLTMAIIKEESGFHKYAMMKEKTGDTSRGLMQVEYSTAKSLGLKRKSSWLYSPWLNIFYGTKYLHKLLIKYDNLDDVISAYNAGRPLLYRHFKYYRRHKYVNYKYVNNVKYLYKKFVKESN